MFCKNCGTELKENAVFCHQCGTDAANTTKDVEKPTPKVWDVFSKVGYIGGLICFITSFIPIIGLLPGVMAINFIVFSALAKQTNNLLAYNKAKKGLSFSIAATIIGIVGYFLFVFVTIILANA